MQYRSFLEHLSLSAATINLHFGNPAPWQTRLNAILRADITNAPRALRFEAVPGVHVKNAGGMAFSDGGHIYVASRTENKIFKFDANLKPLPFVCEPPGNPEFLMHL